MTVQDAWNRGSNLVACAILGLSAFTFLPELFIEDEWQHKIDEGLVFGLGIAAIGWYLAGKHKFMRSITPVIMVWVGFIIKVLGLIIEHADQKDIGDDFGGVILYILASFGVTYFFIKSKKVLEK